MQIFADGKHTDRQHLNGTYVSGHRKSAGENRNESVSESVVFQHLSGNYFIKVTLITAFRVQVRLLREQTQAPANRNARIARSKQRQP